MIKKCSQGSSYYMGVNCNYDLNESSGQNSPLRLSTHTNRIDSMQSAIHIKKRKRRQQRIQKARSPYLVRKDEESVEKKKREEKSSEKKDQNFKEFFRIVKADSSLPKASSQSIKSPSNKFSRKKQMETNLSAGLEQISESNKKLNTPKSQQKSVFKYFPSHFFNTPNKNNKAVQNRAGSHLQISHYFFPSNRVKSKSQKPLTGNIFKSQSYIPIRKTTQSSILNFDGSLQNHQIIPQRPKTAGNLTRKRTKSSEFYSFDQIAKRCLNQRKRLHLDTEPNLMPWTTEQKITDDLLQISSGRYKK